MVYTKKFSALRVDFTGVNSLYIHDIFWERTLMSIGPPPFKIVDLPLAMGISIVQTGVHGVRLEPRRINAAGMLSYKLWHPLGAVAYLLG